MCFALQGTSLYYVVENTSSENWFRFRTVRDFNGNLGYPLHISDVGYAVWDEFWGTAINDYVQYRRWIFCLWYTSQWCIYGFGASDWHVPRFLINFTLCLISSSWDLQVWNLQIATLCFCLAASVGNYLLPNLLFYSKNTSVLYLHADLCSVAGQSLYVRVLPNNVYHGSWKDWKDLRC